MANKTTNNGPAGPAKPEHLRPTLIKPTKFAELKGVKRSAVYYHIHTSHRIIPVLVGADKDLYIDLSQYKDFDFRENNR